MNNLFDDLPVSVPHELVTVLADQEHVRIERIVSTGQSSEPGCWYDQHEDEWVLLLTGSASLRFEDAHEPVPMRPGDHLFIPAGRRHRVEWTSRREATVWLAVFMS